MKESKFQIRMNIQSVDSGFKSALWLVIVGLLCLAVCLLSGESRGGDWQSVGGSMSYYHYQQCNDMAYYTPHTQVLFSLYS